MMSLAPWSLHILPPVWAEDKNHARGESRGVLEAWTWSEEGHQRWRLSGDPPPYGLSGVHYSAEDLPLSVVWDPSGSITAPSKSSILRGLEVWSAEPCSTFEFRASPGAGGGLEDDDVHSLSWEEESWPWDPAIAGLTATWFVEEEGEVRPAGFDILFNAVHWSWGEEPGDIQADPPRLHLGSILTHELGHALGLDHVYEDPAATMFYAYLGGDWLASLSGDDRRGLCALYPSGEAGCASDSDCLERLGEGHHCASKEGLSVCEETRDPLGADCSTTLYNCASMCRLTVQDGSEGYCSQPCEEDSDCPEGRACTLSLYTFPAGIQSSCDDEPGSVDSGGPQDSAPAGSGETAPPPAADSAADDPSQDRAPGSGEPSPPEGCSCGSSGGSPPGLLLLGIGLMSAGVRRRAG